MAGVTRCFDSNIIIDLLNGIQAARELLGSEVDDDAVSVVTWIEVLAGCRSSEEEQAARELLATFRIVPLEREVAEETVRLRRDLRLKLPDAAVLATARSLGCELLTRNTKDFRQDVPEVRVPYEL